MLPFVEKVATKVRKGNRLPVVCCDSHPGGGDVGTIQLRKTSFTEFASGHRNLFRRATAKVDGVHVSVVLKLTCENEALCYSELMDQIGLRTFVPKLYDVRPVGADLLAERSSDSDLLVVLEDLTSPCTAPCVMDLKMGARAMRRTVARRFWLLTGPHAQARAPTSRWRPSRTARAWTCWKSWRSLRRRRRLRASGRWASPSSGT